MTPTGDRGPVTSSYMDSMCVLRPALLVCCRSRAALIFALLLLKMMTMIVMKTTTLVIKATARELVATTYAVLVHVHVSVFLLSSKVVVLNGLLKLPTRFPQTTVCTANMHGLPLVGTSVQLTLVW